MPAPNVHSRNENTLSHPKRINSCERYVIAVEKLSLGKGPSDSVDWKSYANERYGLQITTPSGVRNLVRELDLQNVPLPSIRVAIDEIITWARSDN
jgi:hypothetical protein